jgi:hypothetical protein
MAIISRFTYTQQAQAAPLAGFGANELSVLGGSLPWPYQGGPYTPEVTIFRVPNVTSQSVGSKFTLDSGPIFKQTVDFLTNGQAAPPPPRTEEWTLQFWLNGNILGFPKRHFNGGYPAIDLRGFTIEKLELRIDGFRALQQWTPEQIAVAITFIIRGNFPWYLWWRFWPRLSLYQPQ